MKSIIFTFANTFAKRCLLLGILFFALLGFQGKANASTQNIFIDDFQSYNLGATKTELENNSYYSPYISYSNDPIIKNDNGFIGLGSTNRFGIEFIYDPPTEITTTPTDIKSLFFTIKAENGVYRDTNWWQVWGQDINGRPSLHAMFAFKQSGLIKAYDTINATAYEYTPTDINNPIDFEITSDQITGVFTFKINGNIIFSEEYSPYYIGNDPIDFFRFNGSGVGPAYNNPYIINNVAFVYGDFNPFDAGAYIWADWCGSDAGTLIETTPINLCDVGTAGTVSFDGSKWSWDCIDGVVSQSCRAYLATTKPVDGTCGAWDGETFNTWPPLTELCELKTSLVIPSMVETLNGYTWTCSGINGGTSDYCSGNKTSPPLMPELPAGSLDDCSGLPVLEGLVCKMGNTLKTIFLPSSEKINELNETINKMSSKFPFSYISKAIETFNDVKGNITETSVLELSIMNSEKSSIDFSTIAFFDYIKTLTTILIIIVFSFWLIRFIKHIF